MVSGSRESCTRSSDIQLLLQRDERVLGGKRVTQALVLTLDPVGHFLERQGGHREAVRFAGHRGRGAVRRFGDRNRLALAVRRIADQEFELIQLREHRHALFFVERVGELRHLPPDESLLAAPLSFARPAEPIESDEIGAKDVYRAGDPPHLIPAAGGLDPRLKIAAGQGVQNLHPVGQGRERAGHVKAEAEQHDEQERPHRADGDVADPFLAQGELGHILDADEASHQGTEIGGVRQHHHRVHPIVRLDGRQRADRAQVDELVHAFPESSGGAGKQPASAVDYQHGRFRGPLHLQKRFVDAGRVDAQARRTERSRSRAQWNTQGDHDIAQLVVADAPYRGSLPDRIARNRVGDDRTLEQGGFGRVGKRSVGVQHVEPVGDPFIEKFLGDDRTPPPHGFLIACPDGLDELPVLRRDRGLVLHALDQAVVDLAPQVGTIDHGDVGELRADQVFPRDRGKRDTDADDRQGQNHEQAYPGTQQQRPGPPPRRLAAGLVLKSAIAIMSIGGYNRISLITSRLIHSL